MSDTDRSLAVGLQASQVSMRFTDAGMLNDIDVVKLGAVN